MDEGVKLEEKINIPKNIKYHYLYQFYENIFININ